MQDKTQLPRPPVTAEDVSLDDLPKRSLNGPTCDAPKSVEITASNLARRQDNSKNGDGVLFSDLESAEAHVIGKIGEIVVSDVLDCPLDTNVYPEGDPGHDHHLQSTTIDTKTTRTDCSKPQLIVSAEDTPPSDYFVLVHLTDGKIARVVGFTDRETVVDREARRWPGTKSNYIVGWDELYPPRYFNSLVMGRLVTEMRDTEYIDERACQLCGAHLDQDTETRQYIDELDTEVGVCTDICKSLLNAAHDQERVTDFKLYERPP